MMRMEQMTDWFNIFDAFMECIEAHRSDVCLSLGQP